MASSKSEAPSSFFCPITLEMMQNPVSTVDGHTYEKVAIEQWFASGQDTSPKTGADHLSGAHAPERH
jgi:hypothetical protein